DDGPKRMRDSGAIDQDVEVRKPLANGGKHGMDAFLVADIAGKSSDRDLLARELGLGLRQALAIAGTKDQAASFGGKRLGQGQAYPLSRAGDQGKFAVERGRARPRIGRNNRTASRFLHSRKRF